MCEIAVDIVLLLGDDMAEMAICANRTLCEKFGSEIALDIETCLPHISLAMGCIDKNDVETAQKVVAAAAKANHPQELVICGVYIGVNSRGENVSSFVIEPTAPLSKLHSCIMDGMEQFFKSEVTADMVIGDNIADTTLAWIRNYRSKFAFENFFPHITIGYGQAEPIEKAIHFKPTNLAICHLGNHCTCRKVLAKVPLNKI